MSAGNRPVFKLRWILFVIVAAGIVFSLPLMRVWQHVYTVKLAAANEELQLAVDKLRAEGALLQMELEQLLSNEHVEKAAREKLGLDYPQPEQVRFVEDETRRPADGQKQNITLRYKSKPST